MFFINIKMAHINLLIYKVYYILRIYINIIYIQAII